MPFFKKKKKDIPEALLKPSIPTGEHTLCVLAKKNYNTKCNLKKMPGGSLCLTSLSALFAGNISNVLFEIALHKTRRASINNL
jgi:hypothetical protein